MECIFIQSVEDVAYHNFYKMNMCTNVRRTLISGPNQSIIQQVYVLVCMTRWVHKIARSRTGNAFVQGEKLNCTCLQVDQKPMEILEEPRDTITAFGTLNDSGWGILYPLRSRYVLVMRRNWLKMIEFYLCISCTSSHCIHLLVEKIILRIIQDFLTNHHRDQNIIMWTNL